MQLHWAYDYLESALPLPEYIYSDGNRIKQVLINLVSNALKYTQKGFVQISAALNPNPDPNGEHDFLRISVIDTGVGMNAD